MEAPGRFASSVSASRPDIASRHVESRGIGAVRLQNALGSSIVSLIGLWQSPLCGRGVGTQQLCRSPEFKPVEEFFHHTDTLKHIGLNFAMTILQVIWPSAALDCALHGLDKFRNSSKAHRSFLQSIPSPTTLSSRHLYRS